MSIEPEGFDQSVISFLDQIGFDHAALDLVDDGGTRTSIRSGFSYYSGFPAETTPSRVPTGERRRFVILNTQPGEGQYEILYISANYSNSQADTIRAIIDSVELSSSSEPSEPSEPTEPTHVVITAQVSPPSAGTISGGGLVTSGTEVTLSASPVPGYRFDRWFGNVRNSATASTTIVPTTDVTVTAGFVRQWELVVDAQLGGSAGGGGTYDAGTTVSITATPNDGYRFAGWTGAGVADASEATTSVTLDESRTVSATFVRVWNLGVSASAGGTAEGGGVFDDGFVVPIQAMAEEGYRFAGWVGEGVTDADALVTTALVNADAALTASFVKVWHLVIDVDQGGTVEGAGVVDDGQTTAIVAMAEEGYRFAGWTGEGIEDLTAPQAMVTVTSDTTVTANFVKVWNLSITVGEGGTVQGAGLVDAGQTTIVAMADEGYRFAGWTGEGIEDLGALQTMITVNSDTTVMASFVRVWDLDVTAGMGGMAVGGGTFDDGLSVPIIAMANEGYRFSGWVGDGITDLNSAETTVTINSAAAAVANFIKVWTLDVIGGDGGTAAGGGTFDTGEVVPIVATPSEGYRFGEWSGEGIADRNLRETTATVVYDSTATASFVKVWPLEVTAGVGGTVEGGATVDDGARVPINAIADEGFEFVRWEGSDLITDSNSAQTTVTVSEALNLTAIFVTTAVDPMPDADSDGDGLPDIWEMENGLDSADPGDAGEDFDRDSFTNAEEYAALTDPQAPQSSLRIVRVINGGSGLTLQWFSVPGAHYQVESTNDLSASWVAVATAVAESSLSEMANIDREIGPYYRVRVVPAPSNELTQPLSDS